MYCGKKVYNTLNSIFELPKTPRIKKIKHLHSKIDEAIHVCNGLY